jgi:hypothetical protein
MAGLDRMGIGITPHGRRNILFGTDRTHVMAGLDPAICHGRVPAWMAGSSPATTKKHCLAIHTIYGTAYPDAHGA